MKVWFDTEFLDHGETVELLSIGAVREDGAEFYAENGDCDITKANDWVQQHVVSLLTGPVKPYGMVRNDFRRWVGPNPEFWAYYGAWDWWLLCRLMGGFLDLPGDWPGWVNDINTIRVLQERASWAPPVQQTPEHHALNDAKWVREAYFYLMEKDE